MDKAKVIATADATEQVGVWATAQDVAAVYGESAAAYSAGVHGENTNAGQQAGPGVKGVSRGTGVWGESTTWHAVAGISASRTGGAGVYGKSAGAGILGESVTWHGVFGASESATGGAGVWGESKARGPGVVGISVSWHGVFGKTASVEGGAGVAGEHTGAGTGVLARSAGGAGVWAASAGGEAVHAETTAEHVGCVAAFHRNAESPAAAVYAKKEGAKGHAGYFDGHVKVVGNLEVTGDVTLPNADCAEFFDLGLDTWNVQPGSVMVVDDEGRLRPCAKEYDARVAGVVSGAGTYRPALLLDRRPGATEEGRAPLALVGKVWVLADASLRPVRTGDLLTTSCTPGHAMAAADVARRPGAVIGKALGPLDTGRGLVPMLVSLQ